MSQPRKHHYVPQFYLAGFTRTGRRDDQLFVLDLLGGREWLSSPGNAACAKDFYLIDEEADGDALAIEKLFARVEAAGSEAIRFIVDHEQIPTGTLYSKLIEFIAVMAVRGPAIMQLADDLAQKVGRLKLIQATATREAWDTLVGDMRKSGKSLPPVTWEDMREFARRDEHRIKASQSFKMGGMLTMLGALPDLLGARQWTIIRAPSTGPWFICSDRPVSVCWESRKMVNYSPGFGLRETSVMFPVNKGIALVGRFEGTVPLRTPSARAVGITNMWTATQARQYVYSTTGEFEVVSRDGSVWTKRVLLGKLAKARRRQK